MMNVIIENFSRIALLVACLTLGCASGASAQNFAALTTNQEVLSQSQAPEPQLNAEVMQNVVDYSKSQQNKNILYGPEDSKYTLGPTDTVEITVMRHPEVSGEFLINMEGKIQYNFVGDIVISGLKKDEAAKVLTQKLSDYIVSPQVSVKITGYNSKVVYVVGEVNTPGKIFMRGDTITVRDALLQAGLPMLTGITKKSLLITPADNGNAKKHDVNVYALLYEGDLRENFVMKPGDVLYIPPTFLTKTMRAIMPVAEPIGTAAGAGRSVVSPL